MIKRLDVYLYHNLAGQLVQDEYGQMKFEYKKDWIQKTDAIPLSHSLPLQEAAFNNEECRGFFGGILPEQNQRKIIAQKLGISAENDFAMLGEIGGECAGAVTFLHEGGKLSKNNTRAHYLTKKPLTEILRNLRNAPLMVGRKGIRLSLAGAQDKIALHFADGKFSIPSGSNFSTHIIKPTIPGYDGIVFNEAFCMKLAKLVGLPVANVEIGRIEEIDYLLVERYDRSTDSKGNTSRRHQEDFCQALGIISKMKYQREGGPSLKQCFDLLRDVSVNPTSDISALIDAIIFNFLIGNHDAHGKNFSLLFPPEGESPSRKLPHPRSFGFGKHRKNFNHGNFKSNRILSFAPLYDVLCTVYYPSLSKKMAMKIGDKYESIDAKPTYKGIYPSDFEKLAEEVGLAKSMLVKHVLKLAETVFSKLDRVEIDHPVAHEVSSLIAKRCELIIKRFSRT